MHISTIIRSYLAILYDCWYLALFYYNPIHNISFNLNNFVSLKLQCWKMPSELLMYIVLG